MPILLSNTRTITLLLLTLLAVILITGQFIKEQAQPGMQMCQQDNILLRSQMVQDVQFTIQ